MSGFPMARFSIRSLLPLVLILAVLAGSAVARSADESTRAEQNAAQEASMSEAEREDVLLRKMILMGFPAAAVGGLIIALIVTRKKRPRRPDDAE